MELKSEVEKLNSRLLELFQLDEGFVVALNGKWGIGKTYFWDLFVKNNLSEKLKNKEVVYVSLFGKETLKDIQTDIILQISKFGKIYEKINSVVGSSKYAGIDISAVLSLATKTDFKDIIICFDDFERKSDKLDSKDILGLISQFKEQKSCKIVMIYNQNEVEEKEKKVVSDYKDKVIDYELHYKPTVAESFNAISSKLKVFNDYPLEYLESKGINNIRVIKRSINALNDFQFIAEKVAKYPHIEAEIVYTIIKFALLNAKYHEYKLEDLISYVADKRHADKGKEVIDKKYEDMLFLLNIDSSGYLFETDILQNINYYIKNSTIDKEDLIRIVDEKISQDQDNVIGQKLYTIYSKYNYDLDYSKDTFAKELFSVLQEGGDKIVDIANIGRFLFYMGELIDIDDKYKSFGVETLKKYVSKKIEKETLQELNSFDELDQIKKFDTSIEAYIEDQEKLIKEKQTASMEDIVNLFQRPIKNSSWGNEPDLLKMIDSEVYKKYIIESSEFLQEVIGFIRWTQRFSGGSGFEETVEIITKALFEMKDSDNEIYSFKIEKILKHLNIIKEEQSESVKITV
ncbi:MAG: hypothetical protein GQ570_14140 [Helicobacteraceae bacterium]|nr:hypothetical protein [Helicobacteraceae bacterium]